MHGLPPRRVDADALVCDVCGEEPTVERAAAFLMSQRALATQAEMSATVTRHWDTV